CPPPRRSGRRRRISGCRLLPSGCHGMERQASLWGRPALAPVIAPQAVRRCWRSVAPGRDRLFQLLVSFKESRPGSGIDLVEPGESFVQPVMQGLVVGIRIPVSITDEDEVDARVIGLLGSALGFVSLDEAE